MFPALAGRKRPPEGRAAPGLPPQGMGHGPHRRAVERPGKGGGVYIGLGTLILIIILILLLT